ncbi:hypothetical protein Tco_1419085 [Tanacetum coccineum]
MNNNKLPLRIHSPFYTFGSCIPWCMSLWFRSQLFRHSSNITYPNLKLMAGGYHLEKHWLILRIACTFFTNVRGIPSHGETHLDYLLDSMLNICRDHISISLSVEACMLISGKQIVPSILQHNPSQFKAHGGFFVMMTIVSVSLAVVASVILVLASFVLERWMKDIHYTILKSIGLFSALLAPFSIICVLLYVVRVNECGIADIRYLSSVSLAEFCWRTPWDFKQIMARVRL